MDREETRGEAELGFGRIVSFSDGVFAVAITLLVLTIDQPDLRAPVAAGQLDERLTDLLPEIEAYFLAFAIVGSFWIGHHRFFNDLRGFDVGLMVLNLLYLSLIAFLPVPVEVFGDHSGEKAAVVFFALSMAAVGLVDTLMTFSRAAAACSSPGWSRSGGAWSPSTWSPPRSSSPRSPWRSSHLTRPPGCGRRSSRCWPSKAAAPAGSEARRRRASACTPGAGPCRRPAEPTRPT